MRLSFLFLILFFCSCLKPFTPPPYAPVNSGDSAILASLFITTDGTKWRIPWPLNSYVSSWTGVAITNTRVTGLVLLNNNLQGSIPTNLSGLDKLQVLLLSGNALNGTIPASLTSDTSLSYLWLSSNQLTGNIPQQIGSLSSLIELRLNNNQLTDTIPYSIGSLSKLQILNLYNNRLTGVIPDTIQNLTNLVKDINSATGGVNSLAYNLFDTINTSALTKSFLRSKNIPYSPLLPTTNN